MESEKKDIGDIWRLYARSSPSESDGGVSEKETALGFVKFTQALIRYNMVQRTPLKNGTE